jgi:hypothetical protein
MQASWGLILFIASFILWGLIFALPWFNLTVSQAATAGTLMYGSSYCLFFIGGWALCGGQKPTRARITAALYRLRHKVSRRPD